MKIEYPPQFSEQVLSQTANAVSAKVLTSKTSLNTPKPGISSNKNFFASSRGSKYYPAGCSAGKSLKLENRIYFATCEEAEKAGYDLSSSCR